MAKITSSTEQSAAKTYLNSVDSSGGGLFWIGLTDLSSEGNYKWEDGTSATYFDWYSGEILFCIPLNPTLLFWNNFFCNANKFLRSTVKFFKYYIFLP